MAKEKLQLRFCCLMLLLIYTINDKENMDDGQE